MEWKAKWIKPSLDTGDVAPVFCKKFTLPQAAVRATLTITALGVYEARLNDERVGEFILAPGWTAYYKRLQCIRPMILQSSWKGKTAFA